MLAERTFSQEIRHFHVCGGSGGGKMGFNAGAARVGAVTAVPCCIGGVDVDLAAVADFNRIPGAAATPLDLFTREQFEAFHGGPPPAGWREAVPDDFRRAAGGERPHVVFMSTPCKGFSGLLSERQSGSTKYQALNGLTLRAVWLTLEAWADDPPEFILFENVPRIATRGRWLLDQIRALLDHAGYVSAETTHDCGEIGGLAQSRKRFLLVARHAGRVPPHLFEPEKRRLRGVGEVLDRLPLPGDPAMGPMHRVPNLQWKTWVRLAFVEAGSDWRSLQKLRVADGHLSDFAIAPETELRRGALGVKTWGEAAPTVTSRGLPLNGAFSVADPRPGYGHEYQQLGVGGYDEPASTIINVKSPGQGRYAVADPRPGFSAGTHVSVYRIVSWGEHARTVTGAAHPAGSSCCVADPRATTGFAGKGKYRVTGYGEAAGTVIGGSTTGQGAFAVADPRHAGEARHNGSQGVLAWPDPAGTVQGASLPSNGRFAVADPRMAWAESAHRNKLKVVPYGSAAGTVTGSDRVGSGALCVADPRPDFARESRAAFATGGHYGVLPYEAPSGAVTGAGQHDNGRWSVADPRPAEGDAVDGLPSAETKLVAVIRALDGTWHRPFTTYELAALQGYVDPDDGPLVMEGSSDSAWRERIGNMVPPPSAAAIMSVIARTLLLAWSGETFVLSAEPIWVRPVALAAALDLPPVLS